MATLGILGGIGPASTIDYYRGVIAEWRERTRDGSAPSVLINSIDVNRMLALVGANELEELARWLLFEIGRLAEGGADFGLLAANTPHIVFDDLARQAPIPLISIVEATCDAIEHAHLHRPALFGTRFTMAGSFYRDVFARRGVGLVVPGEGEQAFIHDKYTRELLKDVFLDGTREQLLAIVDAMKEREGIDAVILGGTELPLLLRAREHHGVQLLDTTRIHVQAAVSRLVTSRAAASPSA